MGNAALDFSMGAFKHMGYLEVLGSTGLIYLESMVDGTITIVCAQSQFFDARNAIVCMYRLGVAGIIEKKISIWLGVDLRMRGTFSIQWFNDDTIGFGMDYSS